MNYDIENDRVARDERGFLTKVKKGEAGLLIMEITEKTPFAGYSDKKKTEENHSGRLQERRPVVQHRRHAHQHGLRPRAVRGPAWRHLRWKGENVATMEVEKAIDAFKGVEASAVYGVSLPTGDGRAGMAAIIMRKSATMDFAGSRSTCDRCCRSTRCRCSSLIEDFQWTATHKINKTGLKADTFDPSKVAGKVYVLLPGKDEYVPMNGALYKEILAGKYKF